MENLNGNVLAFLGDAVLSLQVRTYLIECGITRTKTLQETSTRFVSAKAQANYIQYLIDSKVLTEQEHDIYKRGRNAKSASIAKNADVITYRMSTGFEALWGYLHITNGDRLEELWNQYKEMVKI